MSPPSRCDETTVPIREAHLLAVLEPSAPEEWPTFDQVMTAFEATVGTFDEKFVTEKVQVLYEAAVLEAEGKDTEDQVDRLRLLLQQIVSLIGRPSSSSSSSSGATVEVAGASVGAAQRAQAALHHSEQSGTIGIAFCCEAFSAGVAAARRSFVSGSDDRRRRRLDDTTPESGRGEWLDRPVESPGVFAVALRHLRAANLTFMDLHHRWLTNPGMSPTSSSVDEHLRICGALHDMAVNHPADSDPRVAGRLELRRRRIEMECPRRPVVSEDATRGGPPAARAEGQDIEPDAEPGAEPNTEPDVESDAGASDAGAACAWHLGAKVKSKGGPKRSVYGAVKQSEKARVVDATPESRERIAAWLRRGPAVTPGDPADAGAAAAAGRGAGKSSAGKPSRGQPKGADRGDGQETP